MAKTTKTGRGGAVLALAVYSDDRFVREQVVAALGNSLADDLPPVAVTQFATPAALIAALDESVFDCVILDGEAAPLGGMGVSYQIKDEFNDPPPTVLLVARQMDGWLATWSRADGVSPRPIDPLGLPGVVADVIRADQAGALDDTILVPGAASRH